MNSREIPQLPGPILVTGASGFLGEHLVRRLVESRHAVVGTVHRRPVAIEGARMERIDLADLNATRRLVELVRPRVVIHAAALTDVAACERDPALARQAIVDATAHLCRAVAEEAPQARLLALSTDLVFDGRHAPAAGYTEGDAPCPLSEYGRLKLEAEGIALAHPGGCVLRPALLYGAPTTHKGSFLAWLIGSLRRGEKVTLFEDEIRSPAHVDDVIDALCHLAQQLAEGVWLAGGGESLSRYAMGEIIADLYELPTEGLVRTRLADSTYAAPRPSCLALDSAKLWGRLGWRFRGFREGMESLRRSGAFL